MAIQTRALRPDFAAEVEGIDLSQPMDPATIRDIWDAIDRYAVVVFHDQRLSDSQLRNFAAGFGDLEIGRGALQGGKRRLAIPQIGDTGRGEGAQPGAVRHCRQRARLLPAGQPGCDARHRRR